MPLVRCPDCLGVFSDAAAACPRCGWRAVAQRSNLGAGCLGFLFGPVGLWYKGQWAAGFAWMAVAIVTGLVVGAVAWPMLLIVAPAFWIGMALHAMVASSKD